MKRKFFWKDASGVNADIKRHKEMELELLEKIEKYEQEGREDLVRTYRRFLDTLMCSKAEVVDKIGRK